MKIGEQLQKQRKLHKMSQDTLARKLNISRQSISKWENGASLPSFGNVVAISELFDLSLDELIKGDVELMDELESKGRWMSKVKWVVLLSFLIAIVGVIILQILKVNWSNVEDFMPLPAFIALIGLLFSVKWKDVNKILNTKMMICGTIWIACSLIPVINTFIAGFIAGLTGK